MKVLVAVVFAMVFVAVKADVSPETMAIIEECMKESGVDREVVEKALKGDVKNDPKLKKDMFCYNKKVGILDENGNINKKVMREDLKKDMPHADE
ncbi:PBP GOBP domain containing protein, partial [Asbolus verrucosus]